MTKTLQQSRRKLIPGISACLLASVFFSTASAQQQPSAPVSTLLVPATASALRVAPESLSIPQIADMQKRLADWAQLNRYREDNLKFGDPARGEQRVVFLGDSITDAWGRQRGSFFPGKPWINRGISGQTTPQMLVRFQQDVLSLHPSAVVILAGINDIAGNTGPELIGDIENNFRSMVALASAAHVRVVLCSVLPAALIPSHPGVDPREEIAALNSWLQSYAAQKNLGYLNYYPALAGSGGGMRPELTLDGLHPNDTGYAIMGPLAVTAVQQALAKSATGPRH